MPLLGQEIRRLRATRVVIDSLSGFELALAPAFRPDFRETLSRMIATLVVEKVTALMTSELEDRYTDLRFSPYGTAFMTAAIVVQRHIEVDNRLPRMLAVGGQAVGQRTVGRIAAVQYQRRRHPDQRDAGRSGRSARRSPHAQKAVVT